MLVNTFKRPSQNETSESELQNEIGFTILELMIASTVFAVILLVIAVGVISVTNNYYQIITRSQTQSVARTVMSDLSQSIEFGKNIIIYNPSQSTSYIGGVCVDNTLYAYQLGQEVVDQNPTPPDQSYHGLVVEDNITCPVSGSNLSFSFNSPTLPTGDVELLNQYMRLGYFSITSEGNLYTITVQVIYGADSLLSPTVNPPPSPDWSSNLNETCLGGSGSQFCATSELTTTVEQRL